MAERNRCAWVYVCGKNRSQHCTEYPRNGEHCATHKRQIARKNARPVHDLESMKVVLPTPPEPRLQHEAKTKSSIFKLTINFQKSYTKMLQEERLARKNFIKRSLIDLDHVSGYLYNPDLSSGISAKHPLNNSLIQNIESQFYPETGERFDKFHYHGLIRVIHHTKILFNKLRLIRDTRNAGFGIIHVHIQGGRDEADNYLAYARKKHQMASGSDDPGGDSGGDGDHPGSNTEKFSIQTINLLARTPR